LHKKYKNCIYISIHVNAASSDGKWHNGTGWEAYTTKGKTNSDKLAEELYKAA
jgi:N-acetylmuramoyl-L-alanine amidase